jgi:predicted ester cyclase
MILRIVGGKIIEGWQNWDMLGLMEQLQGTKPAAT